nr:MAG: peptide-methionine (S)-S-oxide reductase [Pseudomonadota bacterium]
MKLFGNSIRLLTAAIGAIVVSVVALAQTAPPQQEGEQRLEVATFGSGCFWCTEADFDKVEGVVETISGYMGGTTPNPTYEQVSSGTTGHAEVLQLKYDPERVTYEQLLEVYWRNVDPLDSGGQFCDRGSQYRPVIFYHNEEQKRLAEASKAALEASGRFKQPIVVEIAPASTFTPAEDYHQDFHLRNPLRYMVYRIGCGRDARLEALWGKPKTN